MSVTPVKQPSRGQLIVLRLMIVIGLVCTGFFVNALLKNTVAGYRPLYWLLIFTFIFTCLKIAFEWYYYWDIKVPATPPLTRTYSIDVFTTYCAGEPYEMIVETLTAIQAITYPHTAYLCDEENDAYLRSVCEQLGVRHVTRDNKTDAKAGNINNALQQATGELCLILDPDHIPVPDFFDAIVSHFDNPEIGYVQVVQGYYNQHTGWIAKGAAQQTYHFYGPMMLCMNSYGTVQAIGANCTFRRAALESIGGHAAGLAEDMHTAMQLQARGWRSVYVPLVLSRGLVPVTIGAYYNQQLKWARGVCELLVTSYPKLFTRLTWRQKLHYGLLPVFYFSGFVFLINFIVPVLSLLMGVFPLQMDFTAFAIVSVPFLTSVVLIRHYVQRWVMEDNERGFHIMGGLLLIGTWWVFILGIAYTIFRKKVPYLPTPKHITNEHTFTNNLPNLVILVVSAGAIVYGLWSDWNPFSIFMAGFVALNCLFMLFMLCASMQLKLQAYLSPYHQLAQMLAPIKKLKGYFWILRRRLYSGVRSISLMLSAFIICMALYLSSSPDEASAKIYSYARQTINLFSTHKPFLSANSADTTGLGQLVRQYQNLRTIQAVTLSSPGVSDTLLPVSTYALHTRGVIYTKGNNWYQNVYPLTKKIIQTDFVQMKQLGINTVKIYGPNIYDQPVFNTAQQKGLKIDYSFWVPDPGHFVHDADRLATLSEEIIQTVKDHKANTTLNSWNIGNSAFQMLSRYYRGNQLDLARLNYIKWLRQLIQQIKQADSSRKITVDVETSHTLNETIAILHREIPQIDAFGLIVHDLKELKYLADSLPAPHFYSSLNPDVLKLNEAPAGGVFYANWQDQQAGKVTFDGLKGVKGRNKPYLAAINQKWHGHMKTALLPAVKILKPALTTVPGFGITYHAMVFLNNTWHLASDVRLGMTYEWYLVKTDRAGNGAALSFLGSGPVINVTIPPNVSLYKLYLVGVQGNNIITSTTSLNLPLNN